VNLRFVVPGSETSEPRAGLQIDPTGRLAQVADDDAVRQALLLLIATRPGERVMRPDYGCLLDRLAFAPNDDTTAGLAMHYVRRAVEQWEPRVDVLAVDAAPEPGRDAVLSIVLDYRVRATQAPGQLVVGVTLDGEGVA
jgi:phage baseplate assembly protein W